MFTTLGFWFRCYLHTGADVFGLFANISNPLPFFTHKGVRRILFTIMRQKIYHAVVKGQLVLIIVAMILGALVVYKFEQLGGTQSTLGSFYNMSFIILFRDIAPILCSLFLIARLGAPISMDLHKMVENGEFKGLNYLAIDPVTICLRPYFYTFPLAMLVLLFNFYFFSLITACLVLWLTESSVNLIYFFYGMFNHVNNIDIFVVIMKSLLSSLMIAIVAIFFGIRQHAIESSLSQSLTWQVGIVYVINAIFIILVLEQ
jgi:ABC-type transporter Mla maintaining outer membrane lipid asymmetry permease subunit MlaE